MLTIKVEWNTETFGLMRIRQDDLCKADNLSVIKLPVYTEHLM